MAANELLRAKWKRDETMQLHMNSNGNGHTTLDRTALLERFDGDADLLRDIADVFLAHCPALLADIGNAATIRDATRLRDAAHSLKGSVANFGAEGAVATAFQLERMGRDGVLDDVESVWDELQTKMRDLQTALEQLINDH